MGPIFDPNPGEDLPQERSLLGLAMRGPRTQGGWHGQEGSALDFFDLKAILEQLERGLHIEPLSFQPAEHPSYHPGKCARVQLAGADLGIFGEVHPVVAERLGLDELPLVAGELNLDALLRAIPSNFPIAPVPAFPPVLEDIALIVDESIPAERVRETIHQAGGSLLKEARLFDVYRGEQVGAGKKSLAYALVYQAVDRTLTDDEVADLRGAITAKLSEELGAALREA